MKLFHLVVVIVVMAFFTRFYIESKVADEVDLVAIAYVVDESNKTIYATSYYPDQITYCNGRYCYRTDNNVIYPFANWDELLGGEYRILPLY